MNGPPQGWHAPAEADLIRIAREARGMSPETAAAQTPIRLGGGRWRQIERGYERVDPFKEVRAPDKTLAHMARTVGVSPERLEEAGRAKAAAILREIIRQEREAAAQDTQQLTVYADLSDKHERAVWEMERLPEEDRRTLIDILRAGRAEERRRFG